MDLFRVRLNCVDHYQATPTAFDPDLPKNVGNIQEKAKAKVPVLRVFGATETGQKVCAHIHGAFPYLYIRYNGSLILDDVNAYIHRFRLSIDHALAISYRRNMYDGKTAFVAYITLVKGVPFYGYHVGYDFFLKVYMLNPLHMTRLADLLRQGAIMKKVMQPYESHIQYILQWMCDYNLYGCAYIACSRVKFRSPVPQYLELKSTSHKWHDRTIEPSSISDEEQLPRQSHCSLEVDICVADIVNRRDVKPRDIHHDFIERKHPIAVDEKLVQSMAGLWSDETRRRKARMGELNPGSSPFPPDVLVSMSADPRSTEAGGWIHEEEYREKIDQVIRGEKDKSDGKKIGFDGFVMKVHLERQVKTALESVEDLFQENLAQSTALQRLSQRAPNGENADLEEIPQVDESRLLSSDDGDSPYESDEDVSRGLIRLQQRKEDMVGDPMEQFADEGMQEPLYEGDAMPGTSSENPTKLDGLFPEQATSTITSSAELEALGVRDANDLSYGGHDAFEIPAEFISDISAERARLSTAGGEPSRKKRKTAPPELQAIKDTRFDQVKNRDRLHEAPSDARILGGPDVHKSHEGPLRYQKTSSQGNDGVQREVGSAPSSQEIMKVASGNRKLSFPIVKHPQDPHTIMKLSQKSNSPLKSSQKSSPKSVACADSSEQQAGPSNRLEELYAKSLPSTSLLSQTSRCCSQIPLAFGLLDRKRVLCFTSSPPTATDLLSELRDMGLPSALYQGPYYSSEKDVPERAREYAGKEFKLESGTVAYLPEFDPSGTSMASVGEKLPILVDKAAEDNKCRLRRRSCSLRTWELEERPPTRLEVQHWLEKDVVAGLSLDPQDSIAATLYDKADLSQIDAATQKNKHGFKYSQKQSSTSVQHEIQYMSIMSLEVHVNTRAKLVPNPEQDEISCIFWCLQSEDEELEKNGINGGSHVGVLVLAEEGGLAQQIAQQTSADVEEESSELNLITRMVDIVRNYDPDILTGYEVHGGSWGYMIERARCKYDYNLCDEFSRMKSQSHGRFGKDDDRWGFNHTSTIRVTGRHMINIWRAMRGELNLLQYTMENVVFQLCHRRIPHYAFSDLTSWYTSGKPRDLARVIDYYISRVQLDLEILEQNELVPRTSEQARLLGVDFFSVFSRGSQFKVESLMFRIAKPENFLLPSPSRKQVGQQNALECLPLVMEPQSAFYNSPLLVLDFQSLYPSVMIAYNYCYSTYLGRVVHWRGQNKMGFTDYHREPRVLELLADQINVAPNGIMYVKPEIRKSLLAKMLGEILETRVMVKSGMKVDKGDKTLQRLLNNRQLALKLISNVTYGYTSASFSGRMPCSEIADSIVQTGRETLEKAIALIHSVVQWGAEVVYGDTDSLFVYLKGRTKDEAFDIGQEIAKTITDMNPRPVKLKFEKVYLPCVLLAKKRYVGFKYESKSQTQPDFDAKGIETVRRDGTPAEQKIEERALKILFRSADLSQVKRYFQSQCAKIMRGKVSIQDFCFAKEVKLGTYSDKGLPPPGALISTRRMLKDPRAEPQYGERVPYVVITGAPGARLIDRCVAPDVLLHNDNNELDAEYYISKNIIPPLERIFNLVGANVRQWYDEMPKFQRIRRIDASSFAQGKDQSLSKKTLESYMKSSTCLVCQEKPEEEIGICTTCMQHGGESLFVVRSRLSKAETKADRLLKVCRSCANIAWGEEVKCDSQDCPVFYTRTRHMARLRTSKALTVSMMDILSRLENKDLECPISFRSIGLDKNESKLPDTSHATLDDVMGISFDFIIAYILGGLTFLPAIFTLVLLHAHLTFPIHGFSQEPLQPTADQLQQAGDDGRNLLSRKSAESFAEKYQRSHEPDVAAGYFAVCREYVPGGINGKPPERTTPAGAVVAVESPSVYQSMYRSIFDRKQPPTLDAGKGNGKSAKRARNIFFVVLRHGHLMLYEDSEQLEVKHVISLGHHDVSIYGGGDIIPEGELWIKRNAIRLTRKARVEEGSSKPFFFFSDNCSDKEDFYFALLLNQEVKAGAYDNPPRPQQYDPKHIIGLVQRLHSSEEQLQTRWVNGLIGRLFLALYKTSELQDFVRQKVTKKIARVRKPAFLSGIVLQKIDMGESAPHFTNPRLKDLTIDGDCCVEADFRYSGNFRLEIAATARLDLGARFKAREVNLVLAVVVKKLQGHGLLKFKPPPSNRVWITFENMPDMELSIEPIVSSRQITYGVIHRAIESRIREVVAETIVLPHWDDSPFTDTTNQRFRGGIWTGLEAQTSTHTEHTKIPDESPEDEAELEVDASDVSPSLRAKEERITSIPALADTAIPSAPSNSSPSPTQMPLASSNGASSPSLSKSEKPPKALRSTSFASPADPLLSHASADSVRGKKPSSRMQQKDATTAMMAISGRSQPTSPSEAFAEPFLVTAAESPQIRGSSTSSSSSSASRESTNQPTSFPTRSDSPETRSAPPTPTSLDSHSIKSAMDNDTAKSIATQRHTRSITPAYKNQSMAAIGAATAAAKKWGWGVLARNADQKNQLSASHPNRAGTPDYPIGRGRPLPPLGQPLPFPDGQRSKTITAPTPKRKPLPSALLPQSQQNGGKARSSPVAPLPPRRRQSSTPVEKADGDGLLVVQAPDSEPPSPTDLPPNHAGNDLLRGGNETTGVLSNKDRRSGEDSDIPFTTDHQTVDSLQVSSEEIETFSVSGQSIQGGAKIEE
ncbi:MAG: hypothetical protein Q9217_005731 [Psora testacea]